MSEEWTDDYPPSDRWLAEEARKVAARPLPADPSGGPHDYVPRLNEDSTVNACAVCGDIGYWGGWHHLAVLRAADPSPTTSREGLRELATEVLAAFDARPDTDERDHPGGLSSAQVEEAWARWDIRQVNALEALRAALASPSPQPDPVGLDVDRLARALVGEIHIDIDHGFPKTATPHTLARAIAAEYTRLSSQEPTPEGD